MKTKIQTVNVIESNELNGIFEVDSFSDTPEGNKDAEKMFTEAILKRGVNENIASYIEDGRFEDDEVIIYLIHSI